MAEPKRLPIQVWEPLVQLLSWAMWTGIVIAVGSLMCAAATWVYQWKYPHFNTAVAPVRMLQIAVLSAVLGAAGGIADALLG